MKHYYLKKHQGIFYYYDHGKRLYGYRITYRDGLGKRHEKSQRDLKTIQKAINHKKKAQQRQVALKDTNNLSFKMLCTQFLDYLSKNYKKETTYKSYLHLLKRDAIPKIGKYKLVDLGPIMYRNLCLIPLAKRGLSHRTLVVINSRVQKVLNTAVANQIITHNPIEHVELPKAKHLPKRQIMNDKQLKRFNECLAHHSISTRVIFLTLELTGMRAGELLGLHWKDVDTINHVIHIRHTRDAYGLRAPKTNHSKRSIIISGKLNDLLDEYHIYCRHRYHIKGNTYVMLGQQGHKLIPNQISIRLRKLLIEAGLKRMIGRFTPHSFRHMFASRLIGHGVDPIAVSKALGHSSPEITLKVYSQWANGKIPNVSNMIDELDNKDDENEN